MSQLFAGIYVMEIALIGLFLLVRDSQNNVACKSQATIMIVVLILTAVFHFVMEQHLRPLYEFLPVTVEDSAVDAERRLLPAHDNADSSIEDQRGNSNDSQPAESQSSNEAPDIDIAKLPQIQTMSTTASNARKALSGMKKNTAAKITDFQHHLSHLPGMSRRREVGDQLAAAIAGYPDELTDLNSAERAAQLKAAFQDPVTRESAPIIWIPQDRAGVSREVVAQASRYGRFLQYSDEGAFLTASNKVEVTQPAPDTRPDWLLDWVL
ncbi:MAG: hypothetical protein Q9222_002539 [Ikaeria aurantiellina]